MTPVRRGLILIVALMIAALLAFPLRETIYEIVVIPAAYIAWNLNLVYQTFSQGIWWWVIAFIVFFMIAFSLMPQPQLRPRSGPKPKPPQGQVESLSVWLRRAESGVYFKWLVANRLGKLAYQILLHRESGRPRSVFAPLVGTDWEPTRSCRNILKQAYTDPSRISQTADAFRLLSLLRLISTLRRQWIFLNHKWKMVSCHIPVQAGSNRGYMET